MGKKIIKIDNDDLLNVTGGLERFRRNSWTKRVINRSRKAKDKGEKNLEDKE